MSKLKETQCVCVNERKTMAESIMFRKAQPLCECGNNDGACAERSAFLKRIFFFPLKTQHRNSRAIQSLSN